jgi:hypothetical protein
VEEEDVEDGSVAAVGAWGEDDDAASDSASAAGGCAGTGSPGEAEPREMLFEGIWVMISNLSGGSRPCKTATIRDRRLEPPVLNP